MGKAIFAALAFMFLSVSAKAAQPIFDIGYTTFAVSAVAITTGTAVQLNASKPTGFRARVAKYRFVNDNPTLDIYVGGVSVSTDVYNANLGQMVPHAGGVVEFPVYTDYNNSGAPSVPIYAIAAGAVANAPNPRLSVIWFGY